MSSIEALSPDEIAARLLLERGGPLPLDLIARLTEQGVIISEFIERYES